MRFNGICIVTPNVPRLCAFYREILKLEPEEGDVFKIVPTEGCRVVHLLFRTHGGDGPRPFRMRGVANGRTVRGKIALGGT